MKKIITPILACFGFLENINAQTYLQGIDVLPLSDAAHCDLLPSNTRLTPNEAYLKLKQVVPQPVHENVGEMVGGLMVCW